MPQGFKSVHQIEAEKKRVSLQVNTSLPPLSPLEAKASPLFRNGPAAPVTTFTPREPSPKSSTKNVSALSLLLSSSNSSSAVSSPALAQNERKRMNTSFRLNTPSPLLVSAMNNSLNNGSANNDGTAPSAAATTRTLPHQQELHRAMFRQQAMQQQQQWMWPEQQAQPEMTTHGETMPVAAKSYSKEFGDFASSYRSDSDEDEEVYGGGGGGEDALRAKEDVLLRLDQESERERETLARERGEKMRWQDLSDSDSDEALPSDAVALSFGDLDFSRSFISASSPSLSSPSPSRAHQHMHTLHTHTHTASAQHRSVPQALPPAPPLPPPPQRERETVTNTDMNIIMNEYLREEREKERTMDTLSCRDLLCGLVDHDLSTHSPHTTQQKAHTQEHLLPMDLFVDRERAREKVLGQLQLFAVELSYSDDNNNADLCEERDGERVVEYEIQDFLPPFAAQTLLYDLGLRDFVVTDRETHRVCLFVQLLVGPAGTAENNASSSSAAEMESEREKKELKAQRERDRAALYAEEEFYTIVENEDGEGFYTLQEDDEEGFYTLPDDEEEGFYTLEEDEIVVGDRRKKTAEISTAPPVQQNMTNAKRELPPISPLVRQESETDSDDFDPDTAVPFRTDTDEAKLRRDLERMDREREKERERQQQREREQQQQQRPQASIAMMREDDESLCEDEGDGANEREREFFVRCRSAVSDPWRTVRLLREQKHIPTQLSAADVTPQAYTKTQTNSSKRVSSAAIPIVFTAREGETERDRERERLHLMQPHVLPHTTQKHTHAHSETERERDRQRESDAFCTASQDSLEAFVQRWAESSPFSSEKTNYHHSHLYSNNSSSNRNSRNYNDNNHNSHSGAFQEKSNTPERVRHSTQSHLQTHTLRDKPPENERLRENKVLHNKAAKLSEEDGELDERLLLFKECSGDSDKTDISYEDYASRLKYKEGERKMDGEREAHSAKENETARDNSVDSTLSQTAPRFKRSALFNSHAHTYMHPQQSDVPPFLIDPALLVNNNNNSTNNVHPLPLSSSPSPISREESNQSNQTDGGSQRTTSTSNTTPATRTSSIHAAQSLSSTSFLFPNDREFLMDGQTTPSEFRRNSSTGSRRGSERFNSLDVFPKYQDPLLQKSTVVTSASGTPSQTHRKRSSKKKELVLEGKALPAHRLSHNSHSPTSDALPRRHTYNNAWSIDDRDPTTTAHANAHKDTCSEIVGTENPSAQKDSANSSTFFLFSSSSAAATTTINNTSTSSAAAVTLTPDRAQTNNNDNNNKKNRSWSLSLNRIWNAFSFSSSAQSSSKQAPLHDSNPSESTHHLAQFALVDDLTDLVVEREREPVRPFEPLILPQEKRTSVLVEESEKLADRVKR